MISYEIALHLLALLALPMMLFQMVFKGKYRKSFFPRLGFRFPQIEESKQPLIWLHACSFGETRAILPLIARLKEHHTSARILLTATTETGFEEGKKSANLIDYHGYLPFDFIEIMVPLMKRVRPSLVILSETDVWMNFLRLAKKNGATVIVVNGKISERSFRRLKRFPWLVKRLYGSVDHFYLQSNIYQERFLSLGIAQSKLSVNGNIKWDAPLAALTDSFNDNLGIQPSDFVLTLGSTHAPEETILLSSLMPLFERHPSLKVLLVPRHPERFDEVANLLKNLGLSFSRFSLHQKLGANRILLMDVMGSLRECYSASQLAFVGGSLTQKVGGHNIVEPLFYKVPTLFGPYLHNQPEMRELVIKANAGLEVRAEELTETFERLINDSSLRRTMGENGSMLVASSRGALDSTFVEIDTLLKKRAF